jgi:putative oxidoreductase
MMKMRNKNVGLLIMRIVVGAIFLVAGISKFMNMNETIVKFNEYGFHQIFAWLVTIVETVGGFMMIIGAFTSAIGILLAIVMAVAIVKVSFPQGGFMASQLPLALFGLSLGIVFTGAGKYGMGMVCKCGKCEMCKDAKNTCDTDCGCDCKK